MRTRISKHGKYEIMEGVEREVGDMLQPGDLLTANPVVGPPVQVEVITRLKDRDQYDEFKDKLTPLDRLAFALFDVSGHEQMFFDENAYVVKTSGDQYTLWTPGGDAERDEAPVKIKRRINKETTTPEPQEETNPQVPTEPGLYKDCQGDYVLFHYKCGSSTLLYTYFTLGGKLRPRPESFEFKAEDLDFLHPYIPFARVAAIKDVEVEQ